LRENENKMREILNVCYLPEGGIKGTADQTLAHSWFYSYEPELI